MRLQNRVAIVTGGARGIGRATVERFVQEGAWVAVWDVDASSGQALVQDLQQQGARVGFWQVDVADTATVDRAVEEVVATFGRVDILVNNAGILRDARLVKVKDGQVVGRMRDEDFDAVIRVNLRGVFVCTRAVAPYMIRQRYGRILNASSVVGLYGNFGQTNYVAAKAGVIGMTRVWARELGRYGITVNAVAPGFIDTDMTRGMPEKILHRMVERIPLGRIGRPEDIAAVYAFLASEEAAYINGAVISVDGGLVVGT